MSAAKQSASNTATAPAAEILLPLPFHSLPSPAISLPMASSLYLLLMPLFILTPLVISYSNGSLTARALVSIILLFI